MDASRKDRLRYHLQSWPRQQSFKSLDAAAIRRYGNNIHHSFRKLVDRSWFCSSSKGARSISAAATSHYEITLTNMAREVSCFVDVLASLSAGPSGSAARNVAFLCTAIQIPPRDPARNNLLNRIDRLLRHRVTFRRRLGSGLDDI